MWQQQQQLFTWRSCGGIDCTMPVWSVRPSTRTYCRTPAPPRHPTPVYAMTSYIQYIYAHARTHLMCEYHAAATTLTKDTIFYLHNYACTLVLVRVLVRVCSNAPWRHIPARRAICSMLERSSSKHQFAILPVLNLGRTTLSKWRTETMTSHMPPANRRITFQMRIKLWL